MAKESSPWEKLVVRLISPPKDHRGADNHCDAAAVRRGSPTYGVHAGRQAMWMKARVLALLSALTILSFISLQHTDVAIRFRAAPPMAPTKTGDRIPIRNVTFEGQCDRAAAVAGNRRMSLDYAGGHVSTAAGGGVNSTVDGWWEGCDGSDGRLLDPDTNVWLPSWLRRRRFRYCRRRQGEGEPVTVYSRDEGGGMQCKEAQAIVLLQVRNYAS